MALCDCTLPVERFWSVRCLIFFIEVSSAHHFIILNSKNITAIGSNKCRLAERKWLMHAYVCKLDMHAIVVKVRSHQTRMTWINRAIRTKLDAWTFWVYSLHSRVKFTTQQTWICVMGGASAGSSSLVAKCISVFVKVRSSIVQLRVPTYNHDYNHNHDYFVLHCCLGFSASARNDVTARASSWLVNAARISAKVQIFQLARKKTLNSRRLIRANSAAGLDFASLHWLNM